MAGRTWLAVLLIAGAGACSTAGPKPASHAAQTTLERVTTSSVVAPCGIVLDDNPSPARRTVTLTPPEGYQLTSRDEEQCYGDITLRQFYGRTSYAEAEGERLTVVVSVSKQDRDLATVGDNGSAAPKTSVQLAGGKTALTWLTDPTRPDHSRRALVWQSGPREFVELYWFASLEQLQRVAESVVVAPRA